MEQPKHDTRFGEHFALMLEFRRRRPDAKLNEIIYVKDDKNIHRSGRFHQPLPTEGNVRKIFLKSFPEQKKAIGEWWQRFLPEKKDSFNSFCDSIMSEIQVSNEKSRDLLRIFSVLASYLLHDDESRTEFYKGDSSLDYNAHNFEEQKRRLEIKRKEQKHSGEKRVETKIQEVLEVTTNISKKLQEELESNSYKIESQILELKNQQKFNESIKLENARLQASLQEKLEQEEHYKSTIVQIQKIFAEQSKKREEESEKVILDLKQEIYELRIASRKENRSKRKRRKCETSSSLTSSSSSESDAPAKKRKLTTKGAPIKDFEASGMSPISAKGVSDSEANALNLGDETLAAEDQLTSVAVLEEHENLG